jgi:hypothetical protein
MSTGVTHRRLDLTGGRGDMREKRAREKEKDSIQLIL